MVQTRSLAVDSQDRGKLLREGVRDTVVCTQPGVARQAKCGRRWRHGVAPTADKV
jgi:hypothetical protein